MIFKCDLCEYVSKSKGHLKRHQAYKHDIDVIYYYCDVEDCKYKAKSNSGLKKHKANIHNLDVKWYYCDIQECDSKFKSNGHLTRHKRNVHDINVKYYRCDIKGCDKQYKTNSDLTKHKILIHDINAPIYKCDINNCEYTNKDIKGLRRHKMFKHDINVKYKFCDLCKSKFKMKCHLTRHKEQVHDIGNHKCDFCLYNRNSHILYKDKQGKHKICRLCYRKATGLNSRVEHKWSEYLDKHVGTEYLNCSDKSLKSQGGCQRLRPDKLYVGINLVEIDECDEHQHKWNSGTYSCDEDRISKIYDEEGICGKTLVVIRWNPDHYKVPNGYDKILREERLQLHVKLKKYLRTNPPKDKITIYYMFYDEDSDRISKNYPFKMIYNEEDIEKLNY